LVVGLSAGVWGRAALGEKGVLLMAGCLRACWVNCGGLDDEELLSDREIAAIDAMEDSLGSLDVQTSQIRELITRFEACYHEADIEAERIAKAIGAGSCPAESGERPPERKKQLQDSHDILSAWCDDAFDKSVERDAGGISAEELVGFIGDRTPLKIWQVERIIDKIKEALNPDCVYHYMALDLGEYGEQGTGQTGEHYADHSDFLGQTVGAVIHDTVDGRQGGISLALAIDLLMPCHWDFVGGLAIILKVIGGDLQPGKPYACCSRNIKLTPLWDRLTVIAGTLRAFGMGNEAAESTDSGMLASLGADTPAKRWLAASLAKTIRLQLELSQAQRAFWEGTA